MATMATSGMPSSLNIPAADDTMEISSDAGRADHDIDIDFMGSEHEDNEVDWMLQDAASERGNPQASADQDPHNDDLMYDDADEITYAEEAMQDDAPVQIEGHAEPADLDIDFEPHAATEEPLYDVVDEVQQQNQETYNQPEEETLIDYDTFSDHGEPQIADEQADGQYEAAQAVTEDLLVEEQDETTQPEPTILDQPEVEQHVADADPSGSEIQIADISPTVNQGAELEAQTSPSHEEHQDINQPPPSRHSVSPRSPSRHVSPATEAQNDGINVPDPAADSHDQVTLEQLPVPLDASNADATNQPGIAFDAIHHINVLYGSDQFPLFSSSEDDDPNTYLLQDPVVASSTLVDFFRACRSVLDDDLTDDFQLEIRIDQLGLTIAEDSIHCRDTSLAQIVEVYVSLTHNDGFEIPESLLLHLNIVNRFSAQLTNLFKAASEKKGLSQLGLDHEQSFTTDIEQELNEGGEEEEEHQEEGDMQQDNEVYTEAGTVANTSGNDTIDEAPKESSTQEEVDNSSNQQESISSASNPLYDITQQNELENQDSNDHEETSHKSIDHTNEESEAQAEEEGRVQQESVEDAEHGDGSSSGSSTVQGENQPALPRGYIHSAEDDQWLIDYSDEETENDASSDTAQVDASAADEQEPLDGEQDDHGYFDASNAGDEADETYGNPSEHHTESYDDSAYDANTFDQEFGVVDFEYHEQPLDEIDDHEGAHQDWALEDPRVDVDSVPVQSSGTFEVPDTSEEDEDEITFNDDEFTVDDAETQDTTAQEHSPNSPLGKRSREDEGDGLRDGSDQESKRLKAA